MVRRMADLEEELLSLANGIRIDRATMDMLREYNPLLSYIVLIQRDMLKQAAQGWLTLELMERIAMYEREQKCNR